jgi:hypothetical protein
MGSAMQGGGGVTMCEDPATQNKVDIISIPILYEEDEQVLSLSLVLSLSSLALALFSLPSVLPLCSLSFLL